MKVTLAQRLARFGGTIDERTRRVALASSAGAIQRGVAVIGTFIIFPKVLSALGTAGFGIWGAATSLTMMVTVADFGIGPAILTLVAGAIASNKEDEARDNFTAALIMACGIAVFVSVTGCLVVLSFTPLAAHQVYLIAVFGIAVNIPLGSAQLSLVGATARLDACILGFTSDGLLGWWIGDRLIHNNRRKILCLVGVCSAHGFQRLEHDNTSSNSALT